MAIPIFLTLCGLSVAFLVYVLVQLWREGHQWIAGAEPVTLFHRSRNPELAVLTHRIFLNAHGGTSVIPLHSQTQIPPGSAAPQRKSARILQMPARGQRRGERQGGASPRAGAR